jgi:hypothetical protein
MAKVSITVAGITFSSMREAAAHFRQHYGNVARRIKSGWSYEEALGLEPQPVRVLLTQYEMLRSISELRKGPSISD